MQLQLQKIQPDGPSNIAIQNKPITRKKKVA